MNEVTHIEHCCVLHGCKYGNLDCPVTTGKKEQAFVCENCGEAGIVDMPTLRGVVSGEISRCKWCGHVEHKRNKNENGEDCQTSMKLELIGSKTGGYSWRFTRANQEIAKGTHTHTEHRKMKAAVVRFIKAIQSDSFECHDNSDRNV